MDANKDSDDNTRDENDINESHHVNEGEEELAIKQKTLNINTIHKKLTEDEILAQALVFLLVGYETTASTLSFCTYELALNPSVQDILYEEISSAIDSDGEISYEELSRLSYLDAVLSETLRLYTPFPRLSRIASTDYKLGKTGINVSKGQQIEIPVYAIHHSEEYFENPFKYDPDRFLPQNRHKITPYTYLPFGAGPRNCIGMRFALMETKVCLAHIIRRFKFFATDKTDVPLKYKRSLNLTSAQRIVVGIESRV
ncbi:unnamed protein product [Oppiella nova]|uniref:Cytochrome P450 n=1 Tax=Oppiella nova TaxID=334625 RepID=A0A7R9MA25_9ACAR|nr:unnamed protein product [Oppiella nova]CAG2173519.1 unnamed protein product [Oppiella nova]